MANRNLQATCVRSNIQNYVYLLITTILIVSFSIGGYFLWQTRVYHKREEISNQFNLQTILHCLRMEHEIIGMLSQDEDSPHGIRQTSGQNPLHKQRSGHIYTLGKNLEVIDRLQRTYRVISSDATRFEPVLRKAGEQFATIRAASAKGGGNDVGPFITSESPRLLSFVHSIEQLRRLHAIARDEINSELVALKGRTGSHLLMIFILAVGLGSLIVWRILQEIRRILLAQARSESQLHQSAIAFESAAEGIFVTDGDGNIISANRAFSEITGYSEKEVLGKNPRILKSGRHDQKFYENIWSSLQQDGQWKGEIWDRRKNGEVYPKWLTITAVRKGDGEVSHYVSVFSDISDIKQSEEQLHHLAHHDSLTDLPNRLLLDARLKHALQHAHRERTHIAVLFLDLDHFKKINDTLGHPVGDLLLQMAAKRLLVSVREQDTVARLGGDEMAIVLENIDKAGHAATVAQDILDNLSKPFELEGQEVIVSGSIGISMYPQDGQDVTSLLKNADAAMYMAKSEGRKGYQFYSKALTEKALESLALETRLHRALECDEFVLYYQPQVSLQSGSVVGMEALVRWQHPEMGLIPPDRFIPLAEENGLIEPIGLWVLRTACAQCKAWQQEGLTPLRVAVNLSGRQFRRTGLVQEIRDVLEDTGLDASCLEVELTESATMGQAERTVTTLGALRKLGVTIAIDDFGTGYSSLSYLKRFPVDRLKIDRSFVRDIPENKNDVELAKTIIALGRSLNLSVVAEGVETEEQRRFLTSLGCDEMQGFLYSPPKPANELAGFLRRDLSVCVNN